jgi:hypothetical protein
MAANLHLLDEGVLRGRGVAILLHGNLESNREMQRGQFYAVERFCTNWLFVTRACAFSATADFSILEHGSRTIAKARRLLNENRDLIHHIEIILMSNEQRDPWQSLASDLGVDPAAMPPPAQSTPPPLPPQRAQSSAPPKKSQPGWSSLAAECGIEFTEETSASPTQRPPSSGGHDFVAELLGFPPPQARPAENEQREDEESESREKTYRDDYWQDQVDDVEAGHSDKQSEDRSAGREEYGAQSAGRSEKRGRGRRGGRGRRDDRREPARPVEENDFFAEELDTIKEAEISTEFSEEGIPPPRSDENERSRESRSRRRRGGRGKGRRDDRSGQSQQRVDHRRPESARPVSPEDDELDVDFEGTASVDDVDDIVMPESPVSAGPVEIEDTDDDSHEIHHGSKSSVRDILTWQQAIGMIIDTNMQTRTQAPRHSQRGRGRGHGRHHRD